MMTLSRSEELNPSSLLLSNNRFICRPGTATGNFSDFIAFLPNDCHYRFGECVGLADAYQLRVQLAKRSQINSRWADCHPSTNHRIEHPTGDRYNDAGRPLHLKKLARRSLLHATHQNLAAEIRMLAVMDFHLLPDMGRMFG